MTNPDRPIRVLMSADTARHLGTELSRRRLFGIAGSAALAAFLASCGDDDDDAGGTSGAGSATAGSDSGSSPATVPAQGSGDSGANSFNLFTWAEYDDPDVLEAFGDIEITIFNSNEEAIQKLVTAGGNGGFDVMCPTGVYIPQLVGEDLLQELDLSRIPNFTNLDTPYTNQAWDPGNKHSVCKDWGSTGWIYDKTIVTSEIKTWADFIDVAMNEASGNVSVLDAPADLCGIYFWANGIDWNTTDEAELAACEDFMVNEFAQHIKAFDSYPGINLTQGNYALSQAWNGDARQGLISVAGRRRRPRTSTSWAPRRPRDRAVDGQLVHPQGRRERRRRLQLHQLHPRPGGVGQGDRVPRLQHRRQGLARGAACRHPVPRHGVLHRRGGQPHAGRARSTTRTRSSTSTTR